MLLRLLHLRKAYTTNVEGKHQMHMLLRNPLESMLTLLCRCHKPHKSAITLFRKMLRFSSRCALTSGHISPTACWVMGFQDQLTEVASEVIDTLDDADALDIIDPKVLGKWRTPSSEAN